MIGTVTRNPMTIRNVRNGWKSMKVAPLDPSTLPVNRLQEGTNSSSLRDALHLLSIVAPTAINVLVQGGLAPERSLIAETIHSLSGRRKNAFIKVDCGVLSSARLEKELFGDESSFHSQDKEKSCFERAFQGTLFLNDIEVVPPALQKGLLGVLTHREVPSCSGNRPRKVDVRLIAASGRNLIKLVKQSDFNSELFNLLRIFPIDMAAQR